MAYKQIYDVTNGDPEIIESDHLGNFNYDDYKYTDIQPPNDIYEPMSFDGDKWIGITKEEWEDTLEDYEVEPDEEDETNFELMQSNLELKKEVNQLNEDVANLLSLVIANKGGQ